MCGWRGRRVRAGRRTVCQAGSPASVAQAEVPDIPVVLAKALAVTGAEKVGACGRRSGV